MSDYMDRLEVRIKRLKQDAWARNDWIKARFEIEKHGGHWRAENGTVFELRDGVIYQFMAENGVTNLVISAIDAPVPYIASLDIDAQGLSPERRKALLNELEHMATKQPTVSEFVLIVEGDWLTKISEKRWNTWNWQQHLKPTKLTLESRKVKGTGFEFNENVIYPGDMFEVVA